MMFHVHDCKAALLPWTWTKCHSRLQTFFTPKWVSCELLLTLCMLVAIGDADIISDQSIDYSWNSKYILHIHCWSFVRSDTNTFRFLHSSSYQLVLECNQSRAELTLIIAYHAWPCTGCSNKSTVQLKHLQIHQFSHLITRYDTSGERGNIFGIHPNPFDMHCPFIRRL